MNLPVWLGETPEFPDPALSHWQGLVALGGDLSAERLILAYRQGIFPWYSEGDPIMWWCPDPRAVFFPALFHLSASLRRVLHKHEFEIRIDTAFSDVVRCCGSVPRAGQDGTWILPEMHEAYCRLHRLGHAHSVEVWQQLPASSGGTASTPPLCDRSGMYLAGGVYGVLTESVFCGESMFSLAPNASKIALAALMHLSLACDILAVDCQFMTPHLASLGAVEIRRSDYLALLESGHTPRYKANDLASRGAALFATHTWPQTLQAALETRQGR